jgi:hypothetical protein
MKIRYKTWYWGNYIKSGSTMDGSRITIKTEGFEEYKEELHGWHHSEEFKSGYMLKPYPKEKHGIK